MLCRRRTYNTRS